MNIVKLEYKQRRNAGYIVSKALSFLLHPLVVPIYIVVIMLLSSSLINIIPWELKVYYISLITLVTFSLPQFIYLLMRFFGVVKSLSMSTRGDRVLSMIITVPCYVMCAILLPVSILSLVINEFIFATIACIIVAFVVNLFCKISLRLIAMGGATSMLIYSSICGYGIAIWALFAVIIISGALASARLYLGCNNPLQVVWGYVVGLIVTILMLYFQPVLSMLNL